MHNLPCPVSLATVAIFRHWAPKTDLLPVFVFLANPIHWAVSLLGPFIGRAMVLKLAFVTGVIFARNELGCFSLSLAEKE